MGQAASGSSRAASRRPGTSRLVRWSGSSSAVQVVATLPAHLKPEGVAPIRVGKRRFTVVFSDTSHYLVLEPLTIAHGME